MARGWSRGCFSAPDVREVPERAVVARRVHARGAPGCRPRHVGADADCRGMVCGYPGVRGIRRLSNPRDPGGNCAFSPVRRRDRRCLRQAQVANRLSSLPEPWRRALADLRCRVARFGCCRLDTMGACAVAACLHPGARDVAPRLCANHRRARLQGARPGYPRAGSDTACFPSGACAAGASRMWCVSQRRTLSAI